MSQENHTAEPAKASFANLMIRLAGLWIAAGALFKLFRGTPADLPELVRELDVFDLGLRYKLVITAELAIASIAILRPRLGWPLVVALFALFDAILVLLVRDGVENCGCFGSDFPIPPIGMLAIDSVLLLLVLISRPWRARGGAPWIVLLAALAISAALPWIFDREVSEGTVENEDGPLTNYTILEVEDWVGKDIWDTPLGQPPLNEHIKVEELPLDGLWIFYRQTCDHCAEHLLQLAGSETGERFLALIRIAERTDTPENSVVHTMPVGNFVQHAELPDSIDYVISTPAELVLEGGRVTAAMEGVSPEENLGGH